MVKEPHSQIKRLELTIEIYFNMDWGIFFWGIYIFRSFEYIFLVWISIFKMKVWFQAQLSFEEYCFCTFIENVNAWQII